MPTRFNLVLRVFRLPTRGSGRPLGLGRHLGLSDTLSHDLFISNNACEFQKYEVMTLSVVGDHPNI